jgi:hypothetical protein
MTQQLFFVGRTCIKWLATSRVLRFGPTAVCIVTELPQYLGLCLRLSQLQKQLLRVGGMWDVMR